MAKFGSGLPILNIWIYFLNVGIKLDARIVWRNVVSAAAHHAGGSDDTVYRDETQTFTKPCHILVFSVPGTTDYWKRQVV